MKEYSLGQLLSEFTLIIPEIQREYVWGSNKSVLESFISDINGRIKSDHINVGFLYFYTVPDSEHYVIDGQQRLTSLVLLLFVLSCESEDTRIEFRKLLHVEDPMMAFSYNVRPMTEVFLRELFSHECKTSEDIKKQKWYLTEYDNDPTIKSILEALDLFSLKDLRANITYADLLQKVYFWYFDVQETSQGEELYITMNSRGQKLTDSEQIKPRLFKKSLSGNEVEEYGKKWDDWEEYFYSHRPQQGTDDAIHQVDLALNNFIRVVEELETAKECNELKDDKDLTLQNLESWFKALERIPSEEQFQKEIQRLYGTKEDGNFMVLKSLLTASFVGVNSDREFERVRQTMHNRVIRRGKIDHSPLLKFLADYRSFYKKLGNNSLYDFILSNNDTGVMDDKDRKKITILVRQRDESLEYLFWEAEYHCILKGDISPLLDWVCEQPEDFSMDKFKRYYDCFRTLFEPTENALKQDKDKDLDLVRRALLVRRITDYPRYFDSWTNLCFAYAPKDWKSLFVKNNSEMKAFFDNLLEGGDGEEYKEVMRQMINNYKEDKGDKYSDFVKEPKYCQEKNIQWWGRGTWDTIYLITKRTARSNHANLHAYKYYLHLKDKKTEGWQLHFDSSDMTYTYYSQTKDTHRIRISMQWNVGKDHSQKDHSQMEIGCFMDSKNEYPFGESYLKEAVEPLGYKWNNKDNNNKDNYYYALLLDIPESDQVAFGIMDEHCEKLMDRLAKFGL